MATLMLEQTQPSAHGAQRRAATHDVFTEAHVDMSDREEAEHVH